MKICKYKKCEVCTNADSEVAADFPSSEYCGKCELYEPGDKEDALDHLRYLLDFYVIAEVRKWRTAFADEEGFIEFEKNEQKTAALAGNAYHVAMCEYRREYLNENEDF